MRLRRNEILTGLLVVATLVVLAGVLILLGAPGLFRPLVTYRLYFDNAAGIKLGAPVLLAGRKIGQVSKLYSPVSPEESQRAIDAAKSFHTSETSATPAAAKEKPPRFEVRIDVQVDRSALLYRDARARMITLGLLGETAIDFTEGTEASGRASAGELFAGERVPDFGESIANVLEVIKPVAAEATATLKQLETTAQNLNHITDDNSQLNLALTEFRTFGEHLNQITAEDGSLSVSLANIKQLTTDLTKNDNIDATLANLRGSTAKLKSTLNSISPSLQTTLDNVQDMTATLKSQPWRLVWPSTKKYPEEAAALTSTAGTKRSPRGAKVIRPTPTPTRQRPR